MYKGEPGEEFGGHLTSMNTNDPSMMRRFAPDDDEAEDEEENVVGALVRPNEL